MKKLFKKEIDNLQNYNSNKEQNDKFYDKDGMGVPISVLAVMAEYNEKVDDYFKNCLVFNINYEPEQDYSGFSDVRELDAYIKRSGSQKKIGDQSNIVEFLGLDVNGNIKSDKNVKVKINIFVTFFLIQLN